MLPTCINNAVSRKLLACIQYDLAILQLFCLKDTVPSNEDCVSRQELTEMQSRSRQELAAVKAEMQSQVDQLHSQLHYWQNTTVTTLDILKNHFTATNSGTHKIHMSLPSIYI